MSLKKNFLVTNIHRIKENIKLEEALFLLLALLLPVSQIISTYFAVALLIVVVVRAQYAKIALNKPLLILAGIYLMYCLSLVYSSEFQFRVIEKRVLFLILPAIFMLNRDLARYAKKALTFFAIGCLIALCMAELRAFFTSFHFSDFTFDSRLDTSLSFYESVNKNKNRFFSYAFSSFHQTVYFAMYLCLGLAVFLYTKIWNNKFQWLAICFLIVGIIQTLNKAGFIVLFLILAIKIYMSIKNKRTALLTMLLFLLLAPLVFLLNPRVKNFNLNFKVDKSEQIYQNVEDITNDNPTRTNTRIILWSSAWELIKEHPILGIGAGGSKERLYEKFAVKRQRYQADKGEHAHNQYLQMLLDTGVLGFLLLLAAFFYLFKRYFTMKNASYKYLLLSFIVIVGVNSMFESIFERYSGIAFYSFFYCLFMIYREDNDAL